MWTLTTWELKALNGTRPDELNWYAKDKEKFARNDFVKAARWMIIRKDLVENSTNKTWEEQLCLIPNGYSVPNAAEMAYAVAAYFKVRGVSLLELGISPDHVRTSSVAADGNHVFVGGELSRGYGNFLSATTRIAAGSMTWVLRMFRT